LYRQIKVSIKHYNIIYWYTVLYMLRVTYFVTSMSMPNLQSSDICYIR